MYGVSLKAVFLDPKTGSEIIAYPLKMNNTVNDNTRASVTQLFFKMDDASLISPVNLGWECNVYYYNDGSGNYKHLQTYIVNKSQLTGSLDNNFFVISSIDYSHFVLSFLSSKKIEGMTFVDAIRFFIEELNFKNQYSSLTKLHLEEYPIAKSNGEPFPQIEYFAFQKDLKTVMDELTTDRYTGDGNYDWWVDSYGGVHIVRRGEAEVLDLSNAVIKNMEFRKGIDAVVNQVIIYAGEDLYGVPIYDTVYDAVSIALYGLHDRLEVYKSYRNEIYDLHKDDNPPITNDEFRDLVLAKAREKAKDLINSKGEDIANATLSAYNVVTDVYKKVILPSWADTGIDLYVKKVTYTVSLEGWVTKLELSEKKGLKYA